MAGSLGAGFSGARFSSAQFSIRYTALAPSDPGTWQPLLNRVVAADRAGVDRVVLSGEHVVFGEHLDNYSRPEVGGRVGGVQPTDPDGHFLEPLTTMSFLAGMTSRVRFTNSILLAALRRPIVLAKSAATLDVLSGGRLDLGVGIGWQREEYEAAGLDFTRRGRLLDHTLEVCQLLWREQRATYSSAELSFENIHLNPKPVQPGGVPVWVSGTVNPGPMRRLARFGAGWIPWGPASDRADALVETIPRMRDAVAALGRDPLELGVAGKLPNVAAPDGSPDLAATIDGLPALVEAGVTDVRLQLPVPDDAHAAEDYLTPWVTAFREAASR
ncbi:TIGR03619 family F420-dependent LLM class oxidoreductase [Pseudofrankia inefficax]|uniref:Putative F420-dependent oxidoreductase n=1 Tax=Pseudofrankia inefficax (strain DSM 45817 / CECT 9037 / DDB 130130 / EuI1c) TaxID=298654 RepID=E3JC13_PSEI1|nr:TIGR03619 family F420-dependent LLM class oxidoreductase [Pseudofrankia inefficax]ADP83469.1 putative F420-dependent oxidoreductase [Pseudofrankia inefficax]